MFTEDDEHFFDSERKLHEEHYLAGTNPRQQAGFGRDERDWERYRRVVVAPFDFVRTELVYVPVARRRA